MPEGISIIRQSEPTRYEEKKKPNVIEVIPLCYPTTNILDHSRAHISCGYYVKVQSIDLLKTGQSNAKV